MKVHTFTTRFIQLNNYLPYFPPDSVRQMVAAMSDDEVKEILYYAKHNLRRKQMIEQGRNYLDRFIQEMTTLFETQVEIIATPAPS